MPEELPKLTPTQALLMDLLVARVRLGEPFWPVRTDFNRTYNVLREKGYVTILDGHAPHTVRLRLTPRAHKELIEKADYTPPIYQTLSADLADQLNARGGDPTTVRMLRKLVA